MARYPDDGSAWCQRLFNHLYDHVASLVPDTPCTEIHRAVLQALQSLGPKLPIEYDIVSVGMLVAKFGSSFQVNLKSNGNASEMDSAPQQAAHYLSEMPAILVCQMGTADKTGELLVKDSTGHIHCEVSHLNSPLHLSRKLVLLVTWNFIFPMSSRFRSYLEVRELQFLFVVDMKQLPSICSIHNEVLSIHAVQERIRKKQISKVNKMNVYGRVSALSEVCRNGDDYLFMVQLAEIRDNAIRYNVIIKDAQLLHFARLLQISVVYLFTDLRDMVMKKGLPKERRVLASSNTTEIHLYTPPAVGTGNSKEVLEFCSPPLKKQRGSSSSVSDASLSSATLCSLEINAACSKRELHGEGDARPGQNSLISYRDSLNSSVKGTITRCVLPELGVYELDGKVRLYLPLLDCINGCRGMRCGAVLELHNVHVVKVTHPFSKFVSGLYCCPLSTVRVVQFSQLDSPFRGFQSSRLSRICKKCAPLDIAWIVEVFLSLQQKDKRSSIDVLAEVCKLCGLSSAKRDPHEEFCALPHHCQLLQEADPPQRPDIPTIKEFLDHIMKQVSTGRVRWQGSKGEDPGTTAAEANPVTVCAQWSFGTLKQSGFPQTQLLIGRLQGNPTSGSVELADDTGSIQLVLPFPSRKSHPKQHKYTNLPPKSLVMHYNSLVLIEQFTVFVEKTTQAQASQLCTYVYAKQCSSSLCSTTYQSEKQKLGECSDSTEGSAVPKANDSECLYFRVLNKNAMVMPSLKQEGLPTRSFSAQALVCKDPAYLIDSNSSVNTHDQQTSKQRQRTPITIVLEFPNKAVQWYPYICNGYLYSLSPASKRLPSMSELKNEPCITVEAGMDIKFMDFPLQSVHLSPPVLDVTDMMSKMYLPVFSTVSGAHSSKCDQEMVSFTGVILEHEYRIDHEALAVSTVVSGEFSLAPQTSTSAGSTLQLFPSPIVTLTLRSLYYPDTIMAYCSFREGASLPLGLLPGAVATLHAMRVKSSKSGNIYCTNCASSSVDINSLEGTCANFTRLQVSTGPTPEMLNLPTSCLYDLMHGLLHGCLSRKVVCLRAAFVSVQQVSLQYICEGCHCVVIDGSCRDECLLKKPLLKVEARAVVDDGSGEAHVYLKDSMVAAALGVTPSEWSSFLSLVEKIGQVVYIKATGASHLLQVGEAQRFSLKERAQQKLVEMVNQPTLQKTVNIYCQPFVSSAELKESVIGQKCHLVKLSPTVEYSTLALPRLQLRALAISPVDCSAECVRMMETLENSAAALPDNY